METKEDKRSRVREEAAEGNKNKQANSKANSKCITSKREISKVLKGATMEVKNKQMEKP